MCFAFVANVAAVCRPGESLCSRTGSLRVPSQCQLRGVDLIMHFFFNYYYFISFLCVGPTYMRVAAGYLPKFFVYARCAVLFLFYVCCA